MRDEDRYVRWNACTVLGKLGEKAATNEVIAALINAMRDESSGVRQKACAALGELGEKAATNEVIAAFINATRDKEYMIRQTACEALGNFGEKAATNEVIDSLVNFIGTIDDSDDILVDALVRAMCSYDGMRSLNLGTIGKLCNWIRKSSEIDLTPIPSERLMELFLNSRNFSWLSLVAYVALLQGIAVTVCKGVVKIYDTKGVVELEMPNPELGITFTEAFSDQRREIESDFPFGKETAS
ncbi:unnamed protein product [Rotaria socialis]|uniref:HEAT repeat domain-containing protein n=1 Tax=Rotaria socialis TaxID=392032 RepID=A0A821LP10_9BILA|nr:unnamed protein product [Rotaria socialis]CAF4754607.1 unnamed protein product [Rotaria socialis]